MQHDPEAQGRTVSVAFKKYRSTTTRGRLPQDAGAPARLADAQHGAPARDRHAGRMPRFSVHRPARAVSVVRSSCSRLKSAPEGQITEGLSALMLEARRMQQFGFSAAESDPRPPRPAGRLRARAQRARHLREPRGYQYAGHFLEQSLFGIEFEDKIAATYLPTVTPAEVSEVAKALITDDNRIVLGVAPEKKETLPPSADMLKASMRVQAATVEPWADATEGRRLVEKAPAPGRVALRRAVPEIGATVLTLERRGGVAQAHRVQASTRCCSPRMRWRHVAGQPQDAAARHARCGRRGRAARPGVRACSCPARLRRPRRQSRHVRRQRLGDAARPGDRAPVELPRTHRAQRHARAFDLLKRRRRRARLPTAVQSPRAVFGEKVSRSTLRTTTAPWR